LGTKKFPQVGNVFGESSRMLHRDDAISLAMRNHHGTLDYSDKVNKGALEEREKAESSQGQSCEC